MASLTFKRTSRGRRGRGHPIGSSVRIFRRRCFVAFTRVPVVGRECAWLCGWAVCDRSSLEGKDGPWRLQPMPIRASCGNTLVPESCIVRTPQGLGGASRGPWARIFVWGPGTTERSFPLKYRLPNFITPTREKKTLVDDCMQYCCCNTHLSLPPYYKLRSVTPLICKTCLSFRPLVEGDPTRSPVAYAFSRARPSSQT